LFGTPRSYVSVNENNLFACYNHSNLNRFPKYDLPESRKDMSNRIKLIEYKSKKIVILDASSLRPDEIIALFPEFQQLGIANKVHLYALDVTNTHSNDDIRKASTASQEYIKSKVGTIHLSLVGLSGVQKIIASAINRSTYFASSLDDAKEWLSKQVL
jgi:hypothetical protein